MKEQYSGIGRDPGQLSSGASRDAVAPVRAGGLCFRPEVGNGAGTVQEPQLDIQPAQ